jgi:hypothetical protein
MAAVFSVLSMAAGALATLMMLVMLMAGGANSSPAQILQIKWMMMGVAVIGLGGLVGGIWTLIAGRPWVSAGIGIMPAVVAIGMFVVLMVVQS